MIDPTWSCNECSCWRKYGTREDLGECRKNSPERDPETNKGVWPLTFYTDVCAEFHDKCLFERRES